MIYGLSAPTLTIVAFVNSSHVLRRSITCKQKAVVNVSAISSDRRHVTEIFWTDFTVILSRPNNKIGSGKVKNGYEVAERMCPNNKLVMNKEKEMEIKV